MLDMSSLAFYVEQDDDLLGVLTVEETIKYAARLRYAICGGDFLGRVLISGLSQSRSIYTIGSDQ